MSADVHQWRPVMLPAWLTAGRGELAGWADTDLHGFDRVLLTDAGTSPDPAWLRRSRADLPAAVLDLPAAVLDTDWPRPDDGYAVLSVEERTWLDGCPGLAGRATQPPGTRGHDEPLAGAVPPRSPARPGTFPLVSETVPVVLEAWTADPDPGLRYAVAINQRTPQRALTRLACDPEPWVRVGVATRVGDPNVLTQLMRDPDARVRAAAAGNAATPLAAVRAALDAEWLNMLDTGDLASQVALAILNGPHCPPEWFARLAELPNATDGFGSPLCPPDRLAARLQGARLGQWSTAAANPVTPRQAVEAYLSQDWSSLSGDEHFDDWLREFLEKVLPARPDLSQDALRVLALKSIRVGVSVYLAPTVNHPAFPADVATRLASDRAWVIEQFARCPDDRYRLKLLADPDTYWAALRQVLAGGRSTPARVLATLATDPNLPVRVAAAGNPHTPRAALAALVEDPGTDARGYGTCHAMGAWLPAGDPLIEKLRTNDLPLCTLARHLATDSRVTHRRLPGMLAVIDDLSGLAVAEFRKVALATQP